MSDTFGIVLCATALALLLVDIAMNRKWARQVKDLAEQIRDRDERTTRALERAVELDIQRNDEERQDPLA